MEKRKEYTIDFHNVKYYLEMHFVIRESLEFPDYYGCNWSAFWDCLTDLYGTPMRITIIGLEIIRDKFDDAADKMIEILQRFKHYPDDMFAKDIQIEIVNEDSSVTVIE